MEWKLFLTVFGAVFFWLRVCAGIDQCDRCAGWNFVVPCNQPKNDVHDCRYWVCRDRDNHALPWLAKHRINMIGVTINSSFTRLTESLIGSLSR